MDMKDRGSSLMVKRALTPTPHLQKSPTKKEEKKKVKRDEE